MNEILQGNEVPKDWESSFTVPIYKGKGNPVECSNYRGIRLLEHGMKLYERVLEKRLRKLIHIDKY